LFAPTDWSVGLVSNPARRSTLSTASSDQREKTRERILEAAESVFADRGYHDALVDEIGDRISLSKGGLYFHFPSKEDLFFSVIDRLANKLVSKAEKAAGSQDSSLDAASAALREVLFALSRQKRLARILMTQGYSMGNSFAKKRTEVFDRFADVIQVHLDSAVSEGTIAEVDTRLAARAWLGAMNEIVVHWLYSNGSSPRECADALNTLLLRSVGAVSTNEPDGRV